MPKYLQFEIIVIPTTIPRCRKYYLCHKFFTAMPKKSASFSDDNLAVAIHAVENGMSKKAASKQFNVARSTLQFRLKNKERPKFTCGPPSILTEGEEQILVKWLLQSSAKGFPRRREDLQQSVKQFLDGQGRTSPFKNNLPGKHYINYLCDKLLF